MRTGGVRLCSHVRGESCHRLRKRVLNRRILAWSGTRTTAVFARKTSLYLFSAKSTDRSLRLASRSPRNAAGRMRPGQAESTEAYDRPQGGGWGERNGSKKPAGCRAANNPRRSSGRSQGLGRTKRLKGPAVAGLRRSLPPKDSDTPRARTAECFMYSR